jgi:hypothetical protein
MISRESICGVSRICTILWILRRRPSWIYDDNHVIVSAPERTAVRISLTVAPVDIPKPSATAPATNGDAIEVHWSIRYVPRVPRSVYPTPNTPSTLQPPWTHPVSGSLSSTASVCHPNWRVKSESPTKPAISRYATAPVCHPLCSS